jgi:Lipase (class 3)
MVTYTYSYTTLDAPQATLTSAGNINDAGQIVGDYFDSSGTRHAFLLSGGIYTTIRAESAESVVSDINASGQIIGEYLVPGNNYYDAFLYSGGTYTTINVPASLGAYTSPSAINASGQIVGNYVGNGLYHGFLSSGGTYTSISVTSSGNYGTIATSINTSGHIVGYFGNDQDHLHGFLDVGGNYTTVDVIGSTSTIALRINDSGQITGNYVDSNGNVHGFLDIGGNYTTIEPPGSSQSLVQDINASGQIVGIYSYGVGPGQSFYGFLYSGGTYTTIDALGNSETTPESINDSGQIVGVYYDSNGTHGFLAIPSTDHAPVISNEVFSVDHLTDEQIALEMVKLAIDAYPDAPNPGAYHTFNPLTTTRGIPQDSKAQQDIQAANWHAVSAGELGLNSLGQQGSLQYSFVNGYYQAYDTNDTFETDLSEGDALVLTGLVNGKMTLAVSFAGTDQASDWLDFADFSTHYAKFDPLVSAIKNYIDSHQVDQVFVSGHSLGAAMAQYFMEDARFQNDPRFKAWTIGSPGADNVSSSSPDPRITNFIHALDPVTLVPYFSSLTLDHKIELGVPALTAFLVSHGVNTFEAGGLATEIVINGQQKFRSGGDVVVGSGDAHDANLYFNDVEAYYGSPLLGPTAPTVIVTGSNAVHNLSGIISFSDPDLNDRPTATIDPVNQLVIGQDAFGTALSLSAAQIATFEKAFQISPEPGNTNTGKIDWSYSIPDKGIDFLSVGETVTVRTPVVIDDHQGGTIVQTELVTLKGGRNSSPPSGTTAEMIMSSPSNGDYEIYNVGGNRILAAYYLARVGSPWTFASLGTFQAGDSNDMLLRNASTGAFEAYYVGGNTITNTALVGTVGLDWNLAGIGNFDGASSLSELMLRNTFSGSFELYQVAGGGVLSGSSVAPVGNNFQVKGFGKFSGSAETQMIMQDNTFDVFRGQLELYTYQPNTASLAGINVGKVGSNLSIVGCADLLGNGETQMVMQENNGNFWLYSYDAGTNSLSGQRVAAIGSNFHVIGFGPLNMSGQDEMLMQDAAGDLEVYQYHASFNAFAGQPMGAVGAPWMLDGIAAAPPSGGGAAEMTNAQLVQAMAGFGGGTGAADGLNTAPLIGDTSQQTLLTTSQHA